MRPLTAPDAPRRLLVTGGAGFIGLHLADALSAGGTDEVWLVDDFTRGRRDADLLALAARPNVRLVEGDLTDPGTLPALGGGFHETYHLAALLGVRRVLERPYDVLRVNALLTLNVLDWARQGGTARLLFSSTSEAYAWTQHVMPLPVPTPEAVPLTLTDLANPRTAYAGSKVHGELLVTQGCRSAGLPFVIVRYHNVYGPRMGSEHVVPELYRRAATGENPLTVYSPEHRRAFCYVSDAVEATIRAMRTAQADGATLNVGNDRGEVTIAELARRLLAVAGIDAELRPAAAVNDPVVRRCPDLTRARALLDYEPVVGLDEGLARTIAWYGAVQQSILHAESPA